MTQTPKLQTRRAAAAKRGELTQQRCGTAQRFLPDRSRPNGADRDKALMGSVQSDLRDEGDNVTFFRDFSHLRHLCHLAHLAHLGSGFASLAHVKTLK